MIDDVSRRGRFHRYADVHVARGSVELNGQALGEGDGVRLRHARSLSFADGKNAEVLVFDLPPVELPGMRYRALFAWSAR